MRDYNDGWYFDSLNGDAAYVAADLKNILNDIINLNYEIDNCVRGSYTDCETYEQLAVYIRNLAERLINVSDDIETLDEYESISESVDNSNYINFRGSKYPIKDLDYLDGKTSSYRNELGLENIGTVKYNGKRYTIFDTGISNVGNSNKCAVPGPDDGYVYYCNPWSGVIEIKKV